MSLTNDVYIYGTGTYAQKVRNYLTSNNIKVAGFIDHLKIPSRKIEMLKPTPIYTLDDFKNIEKDLSIIIGIHNQYVNVHEISRKLNILGFKDIFLATQLPFLVHKNVQMLDNYFYSTASIYKSEVFWREKTADLKFIDQDSYEILEKLIHFQLTGDSSSLEEYVDPSSLYFPQNREWAFKKIDWFVDGGAFNGDTLLELHESNRNVENWIGFEPDSINCDLIRKKFKEVNFNFNTILVDQALWSASTALNFVIGKDASSRISSDQNGTDIDAIALDEIAKLKGVVLLKLDVEGAELEVLKGAVNQINYSRPHMAISIYHLPDHLYEIQKFVDSLSLNYRFFIRSHGYQGFDTVLYCLPS